MGIYLVMAFTLVGGAAVAFFFFQDAISAKKSA
jgi:hypothetical protein